MRSHRFSTTCFFALSFATRTRFPRARRRRKSSDFRKQRTTGPERRDEGLRIESTTSAAVSSPTCKVKSTRQRSVVCRASRSSSRLSMMQCGAGIRSASVVRPANVSPSVLQPRLGAEHHAARSLGVVVGVDAAWQRQPRALGTVAPPRLRSRRLEGAPRATMRWRGRQGQRCPSPLFCS